jgi:hypothetical protein
MEMLGWQLELPLMRRQPSPWFYAALPLRHQMLRSALSRFPSRFSGKHHQVTRELPVNTAGQFLQPQNVIPVTSRNSPSAWHSLYCAEQSCGTATGFWFSVWPVAFRDFYTGTLLYVTNTVFHFLLARSP